MPFLCFICELENVIRKKPAATNRKLRRLVNKEYKNLTSNRGSLPPTE
jgi:hypothetical protein